MRAWYIREQKHICGKSYEEARYMEVDLFETTAKEHTASTRRKRELATSLAMQSYNNARAGRYFIQLVATNATEDWVWLHLTYNKENLPAPEDEEQVDRDRRNFLRRVDRASRKRGYSGIKYIGVTGYALRTDGGKPQRHHIHLFLGPCGLSRDELEKLWGKGRTRAERVQLDNGSAEGAAHYALHHIPRKKRWFQSRGLDKPKRPAPNDTKWSRKRLEEAATQYVDDREFWERKYPGYTLTVCEVYITGNSTKHLVVKMHRKDTPVRRRVRNQP